MRVSSHALLWGTFEALDNLISIPVLRNHRDGFSYFRSGGGGGWWWINIWGGAAAACFGRGLVATSRKAKENV